MLDADAGALTARFVSRCCGKRHDVRAIKATLYELDEEVLDPPAATMRKCERLCSAAGIRFTFTIHAADFIEELAARLAVIGSAHCRPSSTRPLPIRETNNLSKLTI